MYGGKRDVDGKFTIKDPLLPYFLLIFIFSHFCFPLFIRHQLYSVELEVTATGLLSSWKIIWNRMSPHAAFTFIISQQNYKNGADEIDKCYQSNQNSASLIYIKKRNKNEQSNSTMFWSNQNSASLISLPAPLCVSDSDPIAFFEGQFDKCVKITVFNFF